MKLPWKSAVALVLSGAALVGNVTHSAAQQGGGLTVQQMTSAPEPRGSNWRFPKISLPKFKDRKKSGGDPPDLERSTASRSAKSEKSGDPIAMARLYEKRGQTDAAVKLYEQELSVNPQNGMVHHRLAVISSRDNNWAKARRHFEAALELMPDHSELLSDLGYALYLQHQLADAEAALQAAIQANPRNLAAHNNLGIVLGVQGRLDESLAEFREVGSEADAYANLAYVHTQLGDVEQAMANLNRALTHNPNLRPAAVALVQLNELKARMKQPSGAAPAGDEPTPALPPASEPRLASDEADNLAPIVSAAQRQRPAAPAATSEASLRPKASETTTSVIATTSRPESAFANKPARLGPTNEAAGENPVREGKLPQTPSTGGLTILKTVPLASKADDQPQLDSSHSQTASLDVNKPALLPVPSMPALATTAESQAPRLIANTTMQRVQAPPLLVANTHLNVHPAPVITPSRAMQELREEQRVTALRENKPLENPFLKPNSKQPAENADAMATAMEKAAAPALFAPASTFSEMNGVALTNYAEEIQAAGEKSDAASARNLPVFSAAAKLPGPMDQLPREAQLLQMPTSKLHPTAQPTWSAQDRTIAKPADQPTMKNAHFFDWTGRVSP